jgi:hypothetical protein
MAARAAILHDVGANAPANWEYPFGTADMHVALAIYAKTDQDLETVLALANEAHRALPAVSVVYRMRFGELPEGRNPFGFKDGLHNPHVEGSGPAPAPAAKPRSRPASSSWAIPTRTARPQRSRFRRSCATTAVS